MIEQQFARIRAIGRKRVWLDPSGAAVETPLSQWWLAWVVTFGVRV